MPPFELSLLNLKGSLYVTRPSLQHYVASREELVARAAEVLGWIGAGRLRLRVEHALKVAALPFHHKDPFDRMLIAQSLVEQMPIASADVIFDTYGVLRQW